MPMKKRIINKKYDKLNLKKIVLDANGDITNNK